MQVRSEVTGLRRLKTLGEAVELAKRDPTIWKISFDFVGERVRLVRDGDLWIYDPIMDHISDLLGARLHGPP